MLVCTHSHCSNEHGARNQGRQRAPGVHHRPDHVGTDAWLQVTHLRRDLDSKHDPGQLDPRAGDLTPRRRKSSRGCEAV